MNSKAAHIILILMLVFLEGICGDEPDLPNERYHLITDRTIYAAGEKILFRALNLTPETMKSHEWSRVLYLELMNASHVSVARGKFFTGSKGSIGALDIPVNVQTGNYYLRAYTRWMRNFPPEEYASLGLVIINTNNPPARSGQQNDHGKSTTALPEADSIKNSSFLSTDPDPDENLLYKRIENQGDFRIKTDRDEYPARSLVSLAIETPAGTLPSAYEYCVSVVPAMAAESRNFIPGNQELSSISGSRARFYPETRGIMLSGRVLKKGSQDPVETTVVHSSILGKGSGYAGSRTNDLGEFHIVLPEVYGPLNLFVATDAENGEILIDNDYSTVHAGKVADYYMSENEKDLAADIMFGAQVSDAYDTVSSLEVAPPIWDSDEGEKEEFSFYGPPMKTILIDDYVALPSLEEFIAELLPEVNIRRKNDEASIRIWGMHADLALYPALILYDYIPVFDLEEFLRLTPEDVERIELVNATFNRGDLTFGGILSVFSRRGDLSGYQLSETSYFFDFGAYSNTVLPVYPDYSGGKRDWHHPDFRNTLFWEPQISTRSGETETLEFYTSDRPGEYVIVVRGVSPKGKVLKGEASFRITTPNP